VLSGEATNTNFIVFGLCRSGLEPSIYRTRGQHANHYATDAVTIEFTAILEFKLLGSVSRAYYIFGEVPNRDTVFLNIIDRVPGAK
jgi:hypothetical protein